MKNLFITGTGRTGTTLVEKLLCNHKKLSILSQPFPFFYTNAKKQFLINNNYKSTHNVLNNYFNEKQFTPFDFYGWLSTAKWERDEVHAIFNEMLNYGGQYTKYADIGSRLKSLSLQGSFLVYWRELLWVLRHRNQAVYCGSKETFCEEFIPFFAKHGVRCIIILRDPRDVMASMNYGRGQRFGGQRRPSLFNLRNWRKSIAFYLHMIDHPNVLGVRYEDLVKSPITILNTISDFLEISPFKKEIFANGIKDQKGTAWKSNSSHRSTQIISRDSVGIYNKALSKKYCAYIEAICYPEMKAVGYDIENRNAQALKQQIRQFQEPIIIKREDIDPNYSIQSKNVNDEIKRINLLFLHEAPASDKLRYYFVFPDTYYRLKSRLEHCQC